MMKIFLRPTENYLAIQTEDQIRESDRKIGYISTNVNSYCWLNAQDSLMDILKTENPNWVEGNSNGGTAEIYKVRFESLDECKRFLRNHFQVMSLGKEHS